MWSTTNAIENFDEISYWLTSNAHVYQWSTPFSKAMRYNWHLLTLLRLVCQLELFKNNLPCFHPCSSADFCFFSSCPAQARRDVTSSNSFPAKWPICAVSSFSIIANLQIKKYLCLETIPRRFFIMKLHRPLQVQAGTKWLGITLSLFTPGSGPNPSLGYPPPSI